MVHNLNIVHIVSLLKVISYMLEITVHFVVIAL